MALPAVALVTAFIILPFFFAFAFSFTNQRLISPNPTEYVGLANYRQLLGLSVLIIEPERDTQGQILRDADGEPDYPTGAHVSPATIRTIRSWPACGSGSRSPGARTRSLSCLATCCS